MTLTSVDTDCNETENAIVPLGRPSGFDPAYIEQVKTLCQLGATDDEMAEFFGINRVTLYRWKLQFPDFCNAIKVAKQAADDRVERSLYQKATGYTVIEQQAIKIKIDQYQERVEVVDVERYIPPDTTAQIFWLKNRRKETWRDKQDVEHTAIGALGGILSRIDGQTRMIDVTPKVIDG